MLKKYSLRGKIKALTIGITKKVNSKIMGCYGRYFIRIQINNRLNDIYLIGSINNPHRKFKLWIIIKNQRFQQAW